jgi:6-pyruvoyltetrahydropterin/6-carboxytetrahydropterin synthase
MAPIVLITHREEFAAAHQLCNPELGDAENRRLYGPCFTLHGHNYEIEVTVAGPLAPGTGMVMNLADLTRLMQEEVLAQVDHKNLNTDVPFLEGVIPTAENLAVAFWERLAPRIEALEPCRLHRIRVHESRANMAEYLGPPA